jgi:hypothetical protein
VVQLICVRAFGTYQPGDLAAEVPDDAVYDTFHYAPAGDPAAKRAVRTPKQKTKDELEAELASLEGVN